MQLQKNTSPQTKTIPVPTPVPNAIPTTIVPIDTTTPTNIPPVSYTETNNNSTFETSITNRQPISSSDTTAKQTIISSLEPDHETVYQTNTFTITYIYSYDMFQVELATTDIQQAENDAVAWFATKGLSKDGVCKIPVQFYPNFEVNQQLKQQGIEVPPLAIGC